MPRNDSDRYSYRPVAPDDLPMLGIWLERPHVAEWWDDTDDKLAEIRHAMGDLSTEPFIVELIGEPELVGIGHGSRLIAAFAETLFRRGAPHLIIDPDPRNGRAIRAYEKAGFRRLGFRTSIYGDALMMVRDA